MLGIFMLINEGPAIWIFMLRNHNLPEPNDAKNHNVYENMEVIVTGHIAIGKVEKI